MRHQITKAIVKVAVTFSASIGSLAAILGLFYSYRLTLRPDRRPASQNLFQGVTYERYIRDRPRPLVLHVVQVDLTAPGIGFLVSPPQPSLGPDNEALENTADTVPGFLSRYDMQVAINGSFFFPHEVRSPLSYYPRVGDGASTMGVGISNGDRYSKAEEGWAALCIISTQDIRITEQDCPPETQQGIAGDIQFVKSGELYDGGIVILQGNDVDLLPRTVIAIDQHSTKLWMVVVDGRQAGYSEGITLAELGMFLIRLGADRALNLDGGGSSTLAIENADQSAVLNAPFQARVPMNLRPVANHFGLYARPLDADVLITDARHPTE